MTCRLASCSEPTAYYLWREDIANAPMFEVCEKHSGYALDAAGDSGVPFAFGKPQ